MPEFMSCESDDAIMQEDAYEKGCRADEHDANPYPMNFPRCRAAWERGAISTDETNEPDETEYVSEEDVEQILTDILCYNEDIRDNFNIGFEGEVSSRTFEESMILTNNKGLVIHLEDGQEFQLTIVKSKEAREQCVIECHEKC